MRHLSILRAVAAATGAAFSVLAVVSPAEATGRQAVALPHPTAAAARITPAPSRSATPARDAAPTPQPRLAASQAGERNDGSRSVVRLPPENATRERQNAANDGPRDWRGDWRDGDAVYHRLGGRYRGNWNPYGYAVAPYAPWYGYSGGYDNNANDGYSQFQQITRQAPVDPPPVDPGNDPQAARTFINQARDRVQADLFASPEWVATNVELTSAQAGLDLAASRVRSLLQQWPGYREAVAAKESADAAIQASRTAAQGEAADPAVLTAGAERKLAAAKSVTDLERNALAADPEWLAARTRQEAAAARRSELLASLRSKVQSDPQWRAAAGQ